MIEDDLYNPEKTNNIELMDFYGYKGNLGKFKIKFKLLMHYILSFFAKISPSSDLTIKLHRFRGAKIGKHVYIGPGVEIDLLYPKMIEIEDYVSIGMHTMIFAHSNPTCSINIKREFYPRKVQKVRILRGSWVPPGCIILPGVTIGPDSIIGAGSVVINNVEQNSLYAGIPAKKIKNLEFKDKI